MNTKDNERSTGEFRGDPEILSAEPFGSIPERNPISHNVLRPAFEVKAALRRGERIWKSKGASDCQSHAKQQVIRRVCRMIHLGHTVLEPATPAVHLTVVFATELRKPIPIKDRRLKRKAADHLDGKALIIIETAHTG